MKCECENAMHETGCNNRDCVSVATIWGTFRICRNCEINHPIPAEFIRWQPGSVLVRFEQSS